MAVTSLTEQRTKETKIVMQYKINQRFLVYPICRTAGLFQQFD